MGQKINPISNRLGIIRGWDSNWYGGTDYASKILEDTKIREYLNARLAKASLSKIVIERTTTDDVQYLDRERCHLCEISEYLSVTKSERIEDATAYLCISLRNMLACLLTV